MFIKKFPPQLCKLTFGILAAVIILTVSSECFFSSQGFEERKETYSCLVNYLHQQNIIDDFFQATTDSQSTNNNCLNVVDQLKLKIAKETISQLDKAKSNVKASLHEEIKRNLTASGEENLLKINSQPSDDENLSRCFHCIKEYLQNEEYENLMLHAKAVNLTVIEFKVWEYFGVSGRVKKLLNEANAFKLKTVNDCENEGKCDFS